MPSGGARARSGPAPDPMALRRLRDEGEWTTLPSAGGLPCAPVWPLSGQSDRECALWVHLWLVKPQALMWERLGLELEAAMYVRRLAEAETPMSPVNLSTLVRQMADSLGLTTPGMRANRWRIAPPVETVKPAERARSASQSARNRLRVIPPVSAD